MSTNVHVFSVARVNESVGLRIRVHLDIYVFKSDNIRPPCGERHLMWIVDRVRHSPCGVHMLTRMLDEPQDSLEHRHVGWQACEIFKIA